VRLSRQISPTNLSAQAMRFTVKRVAPVRLLTPLFVCAAVVFVVAVAVVVWTRHEHDTVVRSSKAMPHAADASAEQPEIDAVLVVRVYGDRVGRYVVAALISIARGVEMGRGGGGL
jgi:hypothetical protein